MRKVRITGLPNKRDGGQGHQNQGQGIRRFMDSTRSYDSDNNPFSAPDIEVNKTMQPVDESEANIEAEKGEVVMVAGQGGIPETYDVGGKKHSEGGTFLKLAENGFVFSDNKSNKDGMLIKDKDLLINMFGMTIPKKGFRGFTPAHIAKKYDQNKWKKVLMDPNSDMLERETAEKMIENNNLKLGQLALIQESMKGFPQGIAKASEGYMNQVNMDPKMFDFLKEPSQEQQMQPPQMQPPQMQQEMQQEMPMARNGGNYEGAFWNSIMKDGGNIPYAQNGFITPELQKHFEENTPYDMFNDPNLSDEQVNEALKKGLIYNNSFSNSYPDPNAVYPEEQLVASQVASGPQVTEYPRLKPGENKARYEALKARGSVMGDYNPGIAYAEIEDTEKVIGINGKTIDITGSGPEVKPSEKETKPKASKKPTYTYNVPDKYRDNDMYDVESESYDPSAIKKGDYIRKADGKWYQAKGLQTISRDYEGDDMATTFGGNEDMAGAYAYLEETLRDPDVRDAYAKKTKEALRNKEYYKGKSGGYSDMYTEAEIEALSDDDLIEHFLKHQKRNYALQANGVDPKDFEDANGNLRSVSGITNRLIGNDIMDADGVVVGKFDAASAKVEAERRIAEYETKKITSLNSAFDSYGIGITADEIDAGELGLEQASYWGYHDLLKDRKNLDPELQKKLKYLDEPSEGFSDEPEGNISPIDSKTKNFYTNTTAGQLGVVKGEEMGYEEAALAEKEKDLKKPGPVNSYAEDYMVNPWAQDRMNLSNLVNTSLGRKKYLGHSFPVNLARPDVLYHDPARAVATNNEQSGMARRANQAFAGSNSTYRNTGIAGKTWAKNLDTIGQYENMNVPIANSYYDKVWEADRMQQLMNSQKAENLYAGNVIANQQFDNTRVADRRLITDARMQMLTNQMETQAWNQQFPNFSTKPGKGGGMWRTGYNRPFVNTGMPGQSSYLKDYMKLKGDYPDASEDAIKAQLDMSYPTSSSRQSVQRGAYTQPPGQGMRNGMFRPLQSNRSEEAAFAARYGAINPLGNYGN
tara:strand:+ start:5025 stop:8132 length:3108 start_codon:yes stop_codon:yes gene_type:complete